jgi:diguanylate cyclase (GGDEF)-like protein
MLQLPHRMTSPTADDGPDPDRPHWLAAQAALLSAVLERQAALLAIKAADGGRYVHVNEALAERLGRAPGDLIGRTDGDLFEPELAAALRSADQAALAAGGVTQGEQRIEVGAQRLEFSVLRQVHVGADGRRWLASAWFDLAAQRQRDAQLRNALEQIEQQQRAISQLRQELHEQHGVRDAATGLYNSAHFEDLVKREVDLSNREHREFALVWIALDPPPPDVALLGEPARRGVLAALGRLLRGNTRAMDASCRLDDGRFAVLLSGVGLATAHARMEGLRRQCATQIVMLDGREIGFTVSMGVASFPHTAHTLDDLLAACEGALAAAQRRGGNHVTLASIRFEPS